MISALTFSLLSFALAAGEIDKLDAAKIMERSQDLRLIPRITAKGTLTTGGGGKESKTKNFSFSRKLVENGKRNWTLTRFSTPAEIKGQAILFLERDQDTNDVFLYLPAYKKTRRVESASQSSSFMGSSFSYSDISGMHTTDFSHKLLGREKCPDAATATCARIESTPKSKAVAGRTGYSKLVQWITEPHFQSVKVEFFDAGGKLLKTMRSKDFKQVSGGKWLALSVHVQEQAQGKTTSLDFRDVETPGDLADRLFSQQALGRD
jgi:hypothetical protein